MHYLHYVAIMSRYCFNNHIPFPHLAMCLTLAVTCLYISVFGFAAALNRSWRYGLSEMGSSAMEVVMGVWYKSRELRNKVCLGTALFSFLKQHRMLLVLARRSKSTCENTA